MKPDLDDQAWNEQAARIIKAELKRRGHTYATLARRLCELDPSYTESPRNLANRIARGKFSFAFVLRLMQALRMRRLEVDLDQLPACSLDQSANDNPRP